MALHADVLKTIPLPLPALDALNKSLQTETIPPEERALPAVDEVVDRLLSPHKTVTATLKKAELEEQKASLTSMLLHTATPADMKKSVESQLEDVEKFLKS